MPEDIYSFKFEKRRSDGGHLFQRKNSEFDNQSIR